MYWCLSFDLPDWCFFISATWSSCCCTQIVGWEWSVMASVVGVYIKRDLNVIFSYMKCNRSTACPRGRSIVSSLKSLQKDCNINKPLDSPLVAGDIRPFILGSLGQRAGWGCWYTLMIAKVNEYYDYKDH